jgi:prepilin-type N-terminal cleavage/methylation domain-containing protein
MKDTPSLKQTESGFSLIELIIAMVITIAITGLAGNLLVQSLRMRTRANSTTDALADAQRALSIMSREIGGAGFNLSDNGIVPEDSITDENGNSTIRIRANLNKFNPSGTASVTAQNSIGVSGEDAGEDVKYFLHPAPNTNLLARYDAYNIPGGSSTVLANRLDALHIHYYAQKVTYNTTGCDISNASLTEVAPSAAKYVVIAACVLQPAVGTPGSPGYQPPSRVLLVSDVALRNSNLPIY